MSSFPEKGADITEKLITLVKDYPIIFDTKNIDYKNNRKKDKAFVEIGRKINLDRESAKTKWRNLRDSYTRHLKCLATTGPSSNNKHLKYKTWVWAEQMSFLKPFMQTNKAKLNVPEEEESEEPDLHFEMGCPPFVAAEYGELECEGTISEGLTATPEDFERFVGNNRKRKIQDPCEEMEYRKFDNNFGDVFSVSQIDDVDLICLGYSRTLKKLSPKRLIQTKFQISQILMEAEMEEETARNSFPNPENHNN